MKGKVKLNEKEVVVVEVPIELLFHENIYDMERPDKHGKKTEDWVKLHLKYGNSSIMRLWPHIKLFRYLMGQPNAAPDEYLTWYHLINLFMNRPPRYTQSGILNKRKKQYTLWKKELETGSDYFYKNPPEAVYNPKGYFNLDDGHHRSVFLYTQGMKKIYVRMKKQDYEFWINKKAERNLLTFMNENKIKEIDTPILHPSFNYLKVNRDGKAPIRLELIFNYLGEENLIGKRIIDIGCETGYFSRQLVREGAIVTGIESDKKKLKMIKKINKLEQVDFNLLEGTFANSKLPVFDIGIRLHSFKFQKENQSSIEGFLKQVNNSIKHLLFWEEGTDLEFEKKLILEKTFFTRYEKLGVTFEAGKEKELGVFS